MIYLLKGYTGYAVIEGVSVHMTSYSLSMNQNVIESTGIGKIYSNGYFNRWKLDAVEDYAQYDLSITCEANVSILLKALYMITDKFHSSNSVNFYDNASRFSVVFGGALLTNVELSVNLDSVAIITFNFVSFGNKISVYYGNGGYNSKVNGNAPSSLVGDCLMPYWAWSVSYKKTLGQNQKLVFGSGLCDFNFSYQQPVTPKYGCCASSDLTSISGPNAIVFGVPNVTWNLTFAMVNAVDTTNNSTLLKNQISLYDDKLEFKYNKGNSEIHIYFSDVYTTSYSPSVGNASDVNKMTVSGIVFGVMSYSS